MQGVKASKIARMARRAARGSERKRRWLLHGPRPGCSQPAWINTWTRGAHTHTRLKLLVFHLYLKITTQTPLLPIDKAIMNGRLASESGKNDQTVVQMSQGGSSSAGGNGSKYR